MIATYIYITCIVLIVLGLLVDLITDARPIEKVSWTMVIVADALRNMMIISIVILPILITINIFSYIESSMVFEQRQQMQKTLNEMRNYRNTAEIAGAQDNVLEFNRKLVRYKWYNDHFDILINDEVEQTKPVR